MLLRSDRHVKIAPTGHRLPRRTRCWCSTRRTTTRPGPAR